MLKKMWIIAIILFSLLLSASAEVEWPDTVYGYSEDDGFHITRMEILNTCTDFVIPQTVKGYAVTSLEKGALASIPQVARIHIPDSITHIDDIEFAYPQHQNTTFIVVRGTPAHRYVLQHGLRHGFTGRLTEVPYVSDYLGQWECIYFERTHGGRTEKDYTGLVFEFSINEDGKFCIDGNPTSWWWTENGVYYDETLMSKTSDRLHVRYQSKYIEETAEFVRVGTSPQVPTTSTTIPAVNSIPRVNSAFEAAFTHTAYEIDKALCLQSAYAAKNVYSQKKIVDFLIGLGFEADSIEQHDYSSSAAHSVGITMANRIVKDENGKPITLYALIIRGTEGAMEWISDFDIGNGTVALGFDEAASRAMKHFSQYVKNNPPLEGSFEDGKYKVWTCGHSRGAAVANLLAGKYLPKYLSSNKLYAYTFATPYVDKHATHSPNVFNFNIAGDLIPYVPFNTWGFERYGLTIYNTQCNIEGVTVNAEANIRLLLSFLSDSVPTQKEYVSRTKEFLQILEGDPASQEVDLMFMVDGILSTCSSVGTVAELIVRLDVNSDLLYVANLLSPGILPEDYVYTTGDFFTTYNNIGASHSMDTYLLWIEQLCSTEK